MRETRQSGSEGGARFNPCPYPYRKRNTATPKVHAPEA
jgi:hypothetical protein